MTTRQGEHAASLGAATAGRFEIARGGPLLTVTSHQETTELYRARFYGVMPMVLADKGRVTIEYPRLSPYEWLRPDQRAAHITLNRSLPWTLVFGGGVSSLRADLRRLTLTLLEIRGGATESDILLPEPRGIVSVRVDGGASAVRLDRPVGSAARLHIAGGVSRLRFDEQGLGAIGGETRLASAGADQAADRYEIEIRGGARALTIGRWGEGGDGR
jgi:hypothetical protein